MDRTSQAEETVRRYSDMVYRLAFARTGNTADAEMCIRDRSMGSWRSSTGW